MFAQAGGSIAWSTGNTKTGLDMWLGILGGGALWVSIYATFVLNFCDFTRSAKSKGSIVRGNFFGIPLNMLLFGLIVVVMTGAQFKIDGTIIDSPSDVVAAIPNTFLLLAASAALLVLTIAVNLMANFVAPIYALTNLFPKHLDFRRAGIISGVIGLLILPWNLYNSPAVITYFLGGLGALLGPLFGIIMADYWILRRAKINVPDLYRAHPEGTYFFIRGVNFRAIVALGISAVAALVLAFSPALGHFSSFAWFIGSGLGAVGVSCHSQARPVPRRHRRRAHRRGTHPLGPTPRFRSTAQQEFPHANSGPQRQHHGVHDPLNRRFGPLGRFPGHRNHRADARLRC